jgi:predicted dehydrogenase
MSRRWLRCGIVGFEFGHQAAFAGALASRPEVQIAAVADLPDAADEARERGRSWAKQHGAPYYDSHQDLLEAEELDLVSLCLPPLRNPEVVEQACARGLHVMSEKPISADTAGAERIAAAVRAAGIRFTFGFHAARFARPIARAISAVRSGAVGEVRVLNCTWLQTRGPRYTISVEEARRRRAAGEPSVGELANHGGYVFLAFKALAGAPVSSVYAESDAFFYESYRIAEIDDMSLVTVEYHNGVVATAIIGRTTTQSLPTTDVRFEVIGSEGALHVGHGLGDRVFLYGDFRDGDDPHDRGGFETPTFGPPSYQLYVADFVEAILQDREPELTIEDALDYHAFLAAAHQSARAHRPIRPSR